MFVILSWSGVIFLVILAGVLSYRVFINYQLRRLEAEKVSSEIAKKKFVYIKQRENEKHIHSLFIWGIGVVVFLFLLFYFTLTLQQKNVTLTNQLLQVNEELQTLKTEQKIFIQQTPALKYPEKGLDITSKDWKSLLSQKDNRKIQGEMEQMLSQKLAPYLGLSTVVITIDHASNKIDLSIQNEERETIDMKETTSKMVKDFAKVKELREVNFQTVALIDGKTKQKEQLKYSRKDTKEFVLVADDK